MPPASSLCREDSAQLTCSCQPACSNAMHSQLTGCTLQVSVVAFKKGQLQVLSHAWDREVGGRLFDEVLFEHFAKEFGDKHKINIKSNARASYRLRTACEKVRSGPDDRTACVVFQAGRCWSAGFCCLSAVWLPAHQGLDTNSRVDHPPRLSPVRLCSDHGTRGLACPAGGLSICCMGCGLRAEPARGATQMKKVLSANADATLSVESIMEDVDVRGKMSRADFEAMSAPILDRVRGPLHQVRTEQKTPTSTPSSIGMILEAGPVSGIPAGPVQSSAEFAWPCASCSHP